MGDSTAGGKGDNRWAGSRLKNLQLTYIKHIFPACYMKHSIAFLSQYHTKLDQLECDIRAVDSDPSPEQQNKYLALCK